MDTQEILELLSNARDGFQIAMSEIGKLDKIKDEQIQELKEANEAVYMKNVELIKKYGR